MSNARSLVSHECVVGYKHETAPVVRLMCLTLIHADSSFDPVLVGGPLQKWSEAPTQGMGTPPESTSGFDPGLSALSSLRPRRDGARCHLQGIAQKFPMPCTDAMSLGTPLGDSMVWCFLLNNLSPKQTKRYKVQVPSSRLDTRPLCAEGSLCGWSWPHDTPRVPPQWCASYRGPHVPGGTLSVLPRERTNLVLAAALCALRTLDRHVFFCSGFISRVGLSPKGKPNQYPGL